MKTEVAAAILACLLAAADGGAQTAARSVVPVLPGLPAAARAAAAAIDPGKLRAHVKFLADDLLEGRGPGTRGGELAARYLATQFALTGLQPAGEGGDFFEPVPLIAVHTIEAQTRLSLVNGSGAAIPLAYGEDIVTKDETGQSGADLDAPIVFVGYGIHAPEYDWDDYRGVDVKGKVVLVVVSEPPSQDERFFKGAALTYYGRWTYKFEEAARRGAVGALVIHRTDLASYGWQVVRNSGASEKSYLTADPLNTLRAASWIHHDAAQRLFAAAGMAGVDAEIDAAGRRGFRAVELPLRLKGHIASAVRSYRSDNVIGMIPGTLPGPGRRRQAVLYTAHYDHLGIDPSIKGDGIFNGAADNATGCAILLELARAFAAAPPPHDVYFAAVTAEEQGLLGSGYLGEHPPLPAEDITLDLNFDELLPVGIPASVDVTGAERTSFFPAVRSTARAFGMAIQPDPEPGAGLYYRSDHFSLARVGIPAFSIGEGTLFEGHPPAWGMEQREDYTAHRYHQPGDEYRPDMDFRGDAKMARFGFVLGWLASSAPGRIEWLAGDEFEKARKKAQP